MTNRIKFFMHKFAISELELAHAINVDRSAIYRLVNGITKNPHIDTIKKIANFLRVEIKDLIADTTVEPQNSLSDNLKMLMAVNNKKLSDIHKETGLSRSVLNNILKNSTTRPHINTLKILANYFNVTIDQFFTMQIEQQTPTISTLPVVMFNEINLYKKNPKKHLKKYFNIESIAKITDGIIAIIKDRTYYPMYIDPCSLVIAQITPKNQQHVVAIIHNKIDIFKFNKHDNDIITLISIKDYIYKVNVTQDTFNEIFVGVIIEQILGEV